MEQQRSVELLVSEARRARAAGDRATWAEALRRALAQRREFRGGDERKLREPLDGELRLYGEDLRRRVAERARAPLWADELKTAERGLLAEAGGLAAEIDRQLADARRDACQRVRE